MKIHIFTDCSGTEFVLSRSSSSTGVQKINQLRKIYQNCSTVYGNLEITYLEQQDIDKLGPGSLDFLDNIEEVIDNRYFSSIGKINILILIL